MRTTGSWEGGSAGSGTSRSRRSCASPFRALHSASVAQMWLSSRQALVLGMRWLVNWQLAQVQVDGQVRRPNESRSSSYPACFRWCRRLPSAFRSSRIPTLDKGTPLRREAVQFGVLWLETLGADPRTEHDTKERERAFSRPDFSLVRKGMWEQGSALLDQMRETLTKILEVLLRLEISFLLV